MVQKKTGVKFLWTPDLGLDKKKIYFQSDKPIERKEDIFRIYQSFLQVNDFILVPVKGTTETDVVYKIQALVTSSKRPTPFVKEAGSPEDRFVTRVFSFKYVSPTQVHQALINMVSFPQGVLPIETAGILVVTDYDYNIQRFEQIIEQIDQPKPDIVLRRIELKYALASDVETMMNALAQTILSRSSSIRGGGIPIQPGIPGSGGEQVKIAADKRTNSVIVLADIGRVDQIEKIIRELDTETGFETSGIYIYHLRHTNALDISRTLNAMYKISVDDKGIPSGGSGARPGQPIGPQPGGATGTTGATSTASGGSTLGTEPTIVADTKSNSVIIITDRNTYKALEQIIRKLDSRRPQVIIKATVVEVTTTDNFDFGAALARISNPSGGFDGAGFTNFGNTTIAPDTTNNTFTITPVETTGMTLALLKDKIGNIGALIRTIETKAKISILDEPEAATVDNGNAEISIKNQVPVQQTTVNQGIAVTSFSKFEEASTTLSISPHISEGGYLTLETTVKIEKFTAASTDKTIPPPKSSREIKTNSIRVPNARTIVIGGIMTQDDSDSRDGVPVLSHIPILGLLFQRTQRKQEKRTLYIFITPYILYDESFADHLQQTMDRKGEVERIRGEMLKRLQVEGPPELAPRSTFRFSRMRG